MFLSMLEEDQKKAFLLLAHKLIDSDGQGVIVPAEKEMLKLMMQEMSVKSDCRPSKETIPALATHFKTRKSRIIALLELIGLGYADENFVAKEKDFIQNLSRAFDIPEAKLLILENWVVRQLGMVQEATTFWREE